MKKKYAIELTVEELCNLEYALHGAIASTQARAESARGLGLPDVAASHERQGQRATIALDGLLTAVRKACPWWSIDSLRKLGET